MPASPTAAQSEASRLNGAASRGPATPEGRARSALNGTRHNLNGPFRLLSGEDAAAFAALRADLRARHAPAGEAEDHWVDELARCQWRQQRLFVLEDAAMTAPLAADPEAAAARLPSLATLARYRARVERDLRLARAQLDEERARRPRPPSRLGVAATTVAQFRWLLARAEEREAQAAAAGAPAATVTDVGQPEPEPAAAAPDQPPLNRQQRRRLEALRRKHGPATP